MHIIVKDPLTGEILAVLCVEREAHSCQVLFADIDHMSTVSAIALGMKVNEIRIIVPHVAVAELEDMGWHTDKEKVVMVKSK